MNSPFETTQDHERRKTPRWPLNAEVSFFWTSPDGTRRSGQGLAVNLGPRGAYVEADSHPPVGTPVHMDVVLPDLRFEGVRLHLSSEGVVVRVEPCQKAGTCSYAFGVSMRFQPEADERLAMEYAMRWLNPAAGRSSTHR